MMNKPAPKGFTLVEIMVAMVIGMIAMVVIMQVFMMQESTKRSTTGGADAQANAGVSSYMLERDLKMAGWGLDASTYGDCQTTYTYCNGAASCGGKVGPLPGLQFASVEITDGANGAPDTLTANYYTNPTVDTYRYPASARTNSDQSLPGSDLTVTAMNGCVVGDRILVHGSDKKCTLMAVTAVDTVALRISHAPGVLNPPADYEATNTWPAYKRDSTVTCLKSPTVASGGAFQRVYSVATAKHQLRRTDNSGATLVDQVMGAEVFDLQARYGVTAGAGTQAITSWVDATDPDWKTPTTANLNRIKAVRFVMVVRNSQYEKPAVPGVCTTTTAAMVAGWSSWATFKTNLYPADWACYRYKVIETTVPLRNVIWGNI